MTWREQLALLLGAASPFALSDTAMAMPPPTPALSADQDRPSGLQRLDYWADPAKAGQLLQLAGHRSHSSHSSHRSHASHVSGSGHSSHYSSTPTYRPAPAPAYTPPARAPEIYTPPKVKPLPPDQAVPPSDGEWTVVGDGNATSRSGAKAAPADKPASERLNQDEIADVVQRVQIALLIRGYDPGPANGVLTDKTREALRAFQRAGQLPVTGAIDMDTLHALGVLN